MPGDLPNPGIEPGSPALQEDSLLTELSGKPSREERNSQFTASKGSGGGGFPGFSDGKNLATVQETRVRSLVWEDPLEKEMATHSNTLAWRIPWMEESGGLQSTGSQRVGHD